MEPGPSRIKLVALLTVGALAATGAGGVALAATAPGLRSAFAGRSAQGMHVSLSSARNGRRTFRYQARMRCSDGSSFTDDPFTDEVAVRHGRFWLRRTTDAGAVHTRIAGAIAGRRAHGTVRIIERYSEVPDAEGNTPLSPDGGILCDSGTVRWTATAGTRR